MKLEASRHLDAVCGEYLLGTLRGAARRRFERALREEPRVALRLRHWQQTFAPRYSRMIEAEPPAGGWKRLESELGLARYRPPWHRRLAVWRGLAAAALAALAIALVIRPGPQAPPAPQFAPIAQLAGKDRTPGLVAHATSGRDRLHLAPVRPVVAGPAQSYEVWLIPAEGGAPLSLAVLGNLDAFVPVAPAHAKRLVPGARLAISVEPAGGSPTGGPTGPVILAGEISG